MIYLLFLHYHYGGYFFVKYILCNYAAAHSLYHKILLQHAQMRMHSTRTSVASY